MEAVRCDAGEGLRTHIDEETQFLRCVGWGSNATAVQLRLSLRQFLLYLDFQLRQRPL